MKRFIALFVLLGVALLAAPGIIGYQVETYYQGLMQQFGKGGVQVVSQEYKREWFGAESSTGFLVKIPTGPDRSKTEELRFSLVSHIVHGPLTTDGLRLAGIQSEIRADDEAILPPEYQATIKTLIDIGGQGTTLINLPATEIPASGQRPAIRFDDMDGEIHFDSTFEKVSGQFALPVLTLSKEGEPLLEIEGMKLKSRSSKGVSGLMLGGGEFEIGRVGLKDQETGTRVELGQLGIDAESSAEGESVSAFVRYRLEKLEVNDALYGPAELKLGFGNLSAKVLAEIQNSVEEVNAQQLPDEKKAAAVLSVLMGNAPGLLKGDPVVTIDKLSVQTPDGLVDGKLSIQSLGLEWKEITNAPVVLSKLAGNASLRMPEKLFRTLMLQKVQSDLLRQFEQRRLMDPESKVPTAEQFSEMATTLVERQLTVLLGQEFLVKDGDSIATEAMLSGGLLSVNGKTIPLPGQPQ